MNMRQRHVVVVGSGLALSVVAVTATRLLDARRGLGDGWFIYAPNSGVVFPPDSFDRTWLFRDGLIGLLAVGIWVALSFWLYRKPDEALASSAE